MKEVSTLNVPSKKITKKDVKDVALMPLIAGLIAILCFIVISATSLKYPLGKYTVLISDLEAQYAPYLFLLKSKLMNLDFSNLVSNFGYSFLLGAGKNFAGTFGYYLSSPFNLLVLLFDSTQTNEFVLLLMCLKISLSAAFMCAFIRERSIDKKSKWPILWGVMYAYSSYVMLFMLQIMWLDGYLLLPLLLLMIERYIKNGKLGGVTAVLLLLFFSNYYMAYMVGVFSFLYLLARMYLEGLFEKSKQPLKIIGSFILRAVLCGLTLGAILVPVGLDTITNSDPTHYNLEDYYVTFSFAQIVDRFFLGYPGDFGEVLIHNLPFIFVSLLVTILCTVYLVSKAFSGREKKLYTASFILIYITLCIDVLDIAWQVFDRPNWFWHREAFVFLPFFLIVSYKAFERLKEITVNDLLKSGAILAGLLLFAQSFGDMNKNDKLFVYNIAFIAVIILILLGMKKEDWAGQLKDMGIILPKILAIVVVFETAILAPMLSSGTATMSIFYGEIDEYKEGIATFMDCADATNNVANGFRSEYENIFSKNALDISGASQYAGYRGVSFFNSNSNKNFGRFLKQLGYLVNYNYFADTYSYCAPDTDAFFSIGTLYCTDEYQDASFIASTDTINFYRNDNVLPLAFPVQSSALDFDFYSLETSTESKNYFEFRNDWYASLFDSFNEDYIITQEDGITMELVNCADINLNNYIVSTVDEETVHSDRDEDSESFDPDDLGLEVVDDYINASTYYQTNAKIPLIISYDVEITRPDELYVSITVPRTMGDSDIYLNGQCIGSHSAGTYYSCVYRLGSFEVGDKINLSISSESSSFTLMEVNFAYFDMESFENQFSGVNNTAVTVNDVSDGYVDLSANVGSDELVLTTIPYENGWTCYVDGVETPIIPYQDALIAIDSGEGSHDITLRFTPPGFKAGLLVSVVGIVGLIAVSVIDSRKKNCNNIAVKKK
ncbi:MAG: YfhO family protein [Saccharofermentans sp.]|nr:YfhO family protein [Saccharofermentans sp.]